MNPDLSKQAVLTIETLCELGCSHVNQLIDDARKGHKLDVLSDFEAAEIELIIEELSQIMMIYNKQD